MTSGCKVGVLIPERGGTLCGCLWRCLRAAFCEYFSFSPCATWWGWLQRITTPHGGCHLIVIFGFESHTEGSGIRTLAPRYHRKSMLLLIRFHFLDVCRHYCSPLSIIINLISALFNQPCARSAASRRQ